MLLLPLSIYLNFVPHQPSILRSTSKISRQSKQLVLSYKALCDGHMQLTRLIAVSPADVWPFTSDSMLRAGTVGFSLATRL